VEKQIRERFNDAILAETGERYALVLSELQLLDGFESYMYEFRRDGRDYILRLGHTHRRSVPMIQAEVDWINFLAAGGAGVAQAVPSARGELVEAVDDQQGGHFLATAFVKAAGGPPGKEKWNERLFVEYGRLLGRLHALTKAYRPSNPALKRPPWDDPMMAYAELWLPPQDGTILELYGHLMAYLRHLPRDGESYGLIHQDAHGGNFFVDDNYRLTLFDFDDCVYGHFAYDLAMVLFYAVANRPDADDFARHFWSHFWPAYQEENWLDPVWLAEIPHFLKLREIDLYAVIHRSFDVDNLHNRWVADFMRGRKQRLEAETPYLNVDFGLT
jgi:amicoumacin kinase